MPFNPSLEDLPIRDIKQQDRERLTFGVEFEFSLAVFSEDQQDPSPEDRRPLFGIVRKDAKNFTEREESVIRHVAKTLTDAGISSLSNRDASRSGNELKVWIVKTDVSVRGPGGDKEFDWYSIEVTTPPYYFSSDAVDTVKRVCEVLTNNYRIVCNESAGVHVHVGSAKEMFSLDTLVNLYATLWTFEPQIQEIHPSHRTSGNEYCESLRTMSGVANQIPSGSSHAARGLAKILGVKTADDLGEMVIGDSVIMAYNIVWAIMAHRHRGSIEVDTKNTIEFRQHEVSFVILSVHVRYLLVNES